MSNKRLTDEPMFWVYLAAWFFGIAIAKTWF